mmetsp:Transcript_23412/g.79305  ORF Transcript_23412/g.79305 Transcript_23412/m.79305 type:complete len:856 (+) Transcript_23412:109-2676(+)|eukprot:CAMPEP_0203924390 /NCGR_PEP_ID=MMETSP0359-20131031/64139_1 /ASSEMBLY_ACC=CAM_ASM_000338 /TAXON_ID=268821 /ORGANISM="Scrippsiella Hangoei, Strain SHTV-5" /LENGTH=855 /DNA_ID=CAMNT_0050852611 /DNA_START=94 /DNA_END=2661 /DNA_ORIENTATION=+
MPPSPACGDPPPPDSLLSTVTSVLISWIRFLLTVLVVAFLVSIALGQTSLPDGQCAAGGSALWEERSQCQCVQVPAPVVPSWQKPAPVLSAPFGGGGSGSAHALEREQVNHHSGGSCAPVVPAPAPVGGSCSSQNSAQQQLPQPQPQAQPHVPQQKHVPQQHVQQVGVGHGHGIGHGHGHHHLGHGHVAPSHHAHVGHVPGREAFIEWETRAEGQECGTDRACSLEESIRVVHRISDERHRVLYIATNKIIIKKPVELRGVYLHGIPLERTRLVCETPNFPGIIIEAGTYRSNRMTAMVTGLTVEGCKTGILIRGKGVAGHFIVLQNVTLRDHAHVGLGVQGEALQIELSNVSVLENGHSGIAIRGHNVAVVALRSDARHNQQAGAFVSGSHITLEAMLSSFWNNADAGLLVKGSKHLLLVREASFEQNGKDGIAMRASNSSLQVETSRLSSNRGAGLSSSSHFTDVIVHSSNFSANQRQGVVVLGDDTGSVVLRSSIIHRNLLNSYLQSKRVDVHSVHVQLPSAKERAEVAAACMAQAEAAGQRAVAAEAARRSRLAGASTSMDIATNTSTITTTTGAGAGAGGGTAVKDAKDDVDATTKGSPGRWLSSNGMLCAFGAFLCLIFPSLLEGFLACKKKSSAARVPASSAAAAAAAAAEALEALEVVKDRPLSKKAKNTLGFGSVDSRRSAGSSMVVRGGGLPPGGTLVNAEALEAASVRRRKKPRRRRRRVAGEEDDELGQDEGGQDDMGQDDYEGQYDEQDDEFQEVDVECMICFESFDAQARGIQVRHKSALRTLCCSQLICSLCYEDTQQLGMTCPTCRQEKYQVLPVDMMSPVSNLMVLRKWSDLDVLAVE